MEPEALYRHLGRLIEAAPDFQPGHGLTAEQMRWLGRARALIAECDPAAMGEFDLAAQRIRPWVTLDALQAVMLALYKALAVAELNAPASAQGTFIPASNEFDAFAAITKVLQSGTRDVLIVDPYMDETILTEFGGSVPDAVSLRLLSDQSTVKASLAPASRAWAGQHGASRPLAVRLAPPRTLHDRVILVDGITAWTVTQSLKDFAKRSPAEIVRADDTAALKISAYEAVWSGASVIV